MCCVQRMRDGLPSGQGRPRQVCARGFTIIELMIVIAIIGILISLTVPAVQSARETARRTQCMNNLKQIGVALQAYHSGNGRFPYGGSYHAGPNQTALPGSTGAALHSWRTLILPYLDQQVLFDGIRSAMTPEFFPADRPPDTWCQTLAAIPAQRAVIPVYQCPSDPMASKVYFVKPPAWSLTGKDGGVNGYDAATSNYFGSGGPTTVGNAGMRSCGVCEDPSVCLCFGREAPAGSWIGSHECGCVGVFCMRTPGIAAADITDGASQTLMVGEQKILAYAGEDKIPVGMCFAWMEPYSLGSTVEGINGPERDLFAWQYYGQGFGSYHTGGANFTYADGSVHFLNATIDLMILSYLGTRAGGDNATVDLE